MKLFHSYSKMSVSIQNQWNNLEMANMFCKQRTITTPNVLQKADIFATNLEFHYWESFSKLQLELRPCFM